MSKTVRMRALETADGKGLFPLDVLDILEKFLNDPILYYPEINVANLKSKEKPENGHVFSPDIFCKIIYQRQFQPRRIPRADVRKRLPHNRYSRFRRK